jgi:uncharacterized RDD family membrane protein YckC
MPEKIVPLEIEGIYDTIYPGFWRRLGAGLLDMLILMPYTLLFMFLNSFHKNMYFGTFIPHLLFVFWYNVYLPKRYGGTPGKLIARIKICAIDSSPIGWREAFLRCGVDIFLSVIMISNTMIAVSLAENEVYNSLTWFEKAAYLSSISNAGIIKTLSNLWALSELIVLLFNKRKRAIHDFIAGTVIIKAQYIEKVREKVAGIT